VRGCAAFPLAPALGSTYSAAGCPALFAGFTATMAKSDFSSPCIIGRVEVWRADLRLRWILSSAFALALSPAAIVTFPAPATSNAAGGFPALRSPACFASWVMGPIGLETL